ncbi:hypothetical protein ES703_120817 [subsurface metagenome]
MEKLDEIEAELAALANAIEILDKDHKDGTVSDVFYFKRRVSLLREHELTLNKLKKILEENDAPEISSILEKVGSGAKDNEVEAELEKAKEAGEAKEWGQVFKEAVTEKKGSIVRVVLGAALRVAKFLLLA